MAAGKYDLYIEQGATFDETFTWIKSDGQPQDLTGYIARMMIRTTVDSNTVLANYSTTNGKITVNSSGQIHVVVPATETTGYTNWGSSQGANVAFAVYDLELESPSGYVTRLLKGKVTLDFEVTR